MKLQWARARVWCAAWHHLHHVEYIASLQAAVNTCRDVDVGIQYAPQCSVGITYCSVHKIIMKKYWNSCNIQSIYSYTSTVHVTWSHFILKLSRGTCVFLLSAWSSVWTPSSGLFLLQYTGAYSDWVSLVDTHSQMLHDTTDEPTRSPHVLHFKVHLFEASVLAGSYNPHYTPPTLLLQVLTCTDPVNLIGHLPMQGRERSGLRHQRSTTPHHT